MKITQRKVYQCEFCKRNMLSAGSMSRHEKFCKENPNNQHKCFDWCVHLEKSLEDIGYRSGNPDDDERIRITHMTCLKLNKKMYSFKLEKKANFKPAYIVGLERMPLECEHHQLTSEHMEVSNLEFDDIDW